MARTGPAHSLIPKKKGAKNPHFTEQGFLPITCPLKTVKISQNFAALATQNNETRRRILIFN